MKVLHVVESFGSGVAKFIELLVNGSEDLNHTILYNERGIPIEKLKVRFNHKTNFIQWKSVRREISIINDIKALVELNIIIKKNKYNVVHLHSTKAGILGQFISLFYPNISFLYTPNGASFARTDVSKKIKFLYIFIEKIVWKWGRANIICVSKSEADLYMNIGVKSCFINNGIKVDSGIKAKTNVNDELIIITSGRISTQKNPSLFNQIALAFEQNKAIKFVWIGDGELKEVLTSTNIKVTGWLLPKDVERYLSEANVYISTALWEGLPFSVLEAMKIGLPLLLSDCIGNVDLVRDSENGFLFKNHQEAIECITIYLKNKSYILSHGLASYNLLKTEYNEEKMFNQYRALYIKRRD